MLLRLVCSLFLLLGSLCATADTTDTPEEITFILSPANKPPFWYQQGGKARGLVPELLRSIAREQNFRLQMLQVPRKRGIELIRRNPHILMGLAREWVPDPEHFSFTEPVAHTRDVLISHRTHPVHLQQSPEELSGRLLGTHFGYHYPTLEPLFSRNLLVRSDSHSEQALLERLRRQRIDVAVMTESVARWYITRYGWHQELVMDQLPVASADLRLMAHSSNGPLIARINQALAKRRADGSLQALQARFFNQPKAHTAVADLQAPAPPVANMP